MLKISVTAESSADPQQVLEAAGDFSARRAELWSNVSADRFEVHESGSTFAEVTEATWVVGVFWERSRYDWSQPGSIRGTVVDSNVFAPGSTWELRVRPRDGGSEAEMILTRGFQKGPKGRIAAAANHTVARLFWRPYLKGFLKKVEKSGA